MKIERSGHHRNWSEKVPHKVPPRLSPYRSLFIALALIYSLFIET